MKSYKNAFELITDDPVEIKMLEKKSGLVNDISDHIKDNCLTQKQAAEIIGTEQPRVSRLLGGRMSEFSVDWLFKALLKLQA